MNGIVFTGGIGEHAPVIRSRVCRGSAWLGVKIDEELNSAGQRCISPGSSPVSVWIVPTDEELMIALHTRRMLEGK